MGATDDGGYAAPAAAYVPAGAPREHGMDGPGAGADTGRPDDACHGARTSHAIHGSCAPGGAAGRGCLVPAAVTRVLCLTNTSGAGRASGPSRHCRLLPWLAWVHG